MFIQKPKDEEIDVDMQQISSPLWVYRHVMFNLTNITRRKKKNTLCLIPGLYIAFIRSWNSY